MSSQSRQQSTQGQSPQNATQAAGSDTIQMPPNSVMQAALDLRQREVEAAESPELAAVTPAPHPIEDVFLQTPCEVMLAWDLDELAAAIDQFITMVCGAGARNDEAAETDGPDAGAAVDAGECAQEPVRALDEDADYLNQRDNETQGGRTGDQQCAPTALTMSLLALHDNDEATLINATMALLEEQGQSAAEGRSPEELVIQLMQSTNWTAAYEQAPQFFEHDSGWRTPRYDGGAVIKSPYAQAFTASRYEACADQGATIVSTATTIVDGRSFDKMGFDERWDFALDSWRQGGEVNFEGDFTDSGHVVHIVDITEARMVVHDPYGMRLSRAYLRNGESPGTLDAADLEVFERRANGQAGLHAALESAQSSDSWGRFNLYTRDELKALDALRWLVVIHPTAPEQTCEAA